MNLVEFITGIVNQLNKLEGKITSDRHFLKSEIEEILRSARKENLIFLDAVLNIKKLSMFDATLIMSRKNLNLEKINVIKKAINIFSEKGLETKGETLSDFISKVCANLDILDLSNIEHFRKIANIRNDIYDFSKIINDEIAISKNKEYAFAFEKIVMD